MMLTEIRTYLQQPVSASGLQFFRGGFGLLMLFSTIRYWYNGWIDELLIDPDFHFTYLGFEWVKPWTQPWMNVHFMAMGIAAFLVAMGWYYRLASAIFFLLFTYVELIEKACYLNHYYFVSLIAFLLVLLPGPQRLETKSAAVIPRITYVALRVQVGVVYFYAGLAKISADWLIHGEPLYTWLQSYGHWPVIGSWLLERNVAILMSWGGAFFDLTIVFWLLWPVTRRYAYLVSCCFHLIVWLLFPIGIFSWVMMLSATIFFAPDWRKKQSSPIRKPIQVPSSRVQFALIGIFLSLQVLLPLRHVLYPGPVNWTEQGFRFAWRVMLIEKAGHVEYKAQLEDKTITIFPQRELPRFQYKMLSTQPDMIHQYALHLADRFRQQGHTQVTIYAQSRVWFNGRLSQTYIKPDVDLASEPQGFHHKHWIMPLQQIDLKTKP